MAARIHLGAVEYTVDDTPSRHDRELVFQYLSVESYWAKGVDRERLDRALDHSWCIGVYDEEAQVAFARVVTDYATFAYLCDVFVLPEHRSRGLASALLQFIHDDRRLVGIRRFLLGTRDAHSLYEKFGWTPLANPERFMEILQPYR